MFGVPDKDKIRSAFANYEQRLEALKLESVTTDKFDKVKSISDPRVLNIEQFISELKQAFDQKD